MAMDPKRDTAYARSVLKDLPLDMIISDLDGTLLSPGGTVDDVVIEAVGRLLQAGFRMAIASGRIKASVLEIMEKLGIQEPYISCGGAYIADPANGHVLLHQVFDRGTVEKIVFLARQSRVAVLFEEPERMTLEGSDEVSRELDKMAGMHIPRVDDFFVECTTLPTKIVLIGEADVLQALDPVLEAMEDEIHIASTFTTLRDVTPAGMSKGNGLQLLSDYIGIPTKRMLVIGDGWNDKSMFDLAAAGVAVANATPNVLEAADLIAPKNTEHGVAWVIDQLLASRDTAGRADSPGEPTS